MRSAVSFSFLLLIVAVGCDKTTTTATTANPEPTPRPMDPATSQPTTSGTKPTPPVIDPPIQPPVPTPDTPDLNTLVPTDLSQYGIPATIDLPKGMRGEKNGEFEIRFGIGERDGFSYLTLLQASDTVEVGMKNHMLHPSSVILKKKENAIQLREGDEKFGTIYMRHDLKLGTRSLSARADGVFGKAFVDAKWRSILSLRQSDTQKQAMLDRDGRIEALKAKKFIVSDNFVRGATIGLDVQQLDPNLMADIVKIGNFNKLQLFGTMPADAEILSRIAELTTLAELKLSGAWVKDELLEAVIDFPIRTLV